MQQQVHKITKKTFLFLFTAIITAIKYSVQKRDKIVNNFLTFLC